MYLHRKSVAVEVEVATQPYKSNVLPFKPKHRQGVAVMTNESRASEKVAQASITRLVATVSAVLHSLMVAAVIWVGTNINNANINIAKFGSDFASVQARQEEMAKTLSRLHDSVLVMSSTYATKEDVTESIEKIQGDVIEMKRGLTVVEAKLQALSAHEDIEHPQQPSAGKKR